MKCYVINLDRSADRLKYISDRLAFLGLRFERISAVDAASLSDRHIKDDLTLSEVACFLSHRKCWEAFVLSGDDYCAIFEDDVIISDDAKIFLNSEEWIPNNINIVKIETYNENCFIGRFGEKIVNGRLLSKLSSWHAGAAAYIISKNKAMELLINTSSGFDYPVDFIMFDRVVGKLWKSDVLQMVPALCVQTDRKFDQSDVFVSTIKHTTVKPNVLSGNDRNLAGKLVREVSRLKMKALNRRIRVGFE